MTMAIKIKHSISHQSSSNQALEWLSVPDVDRRSLLVAGGCTTTLGCTCTTSCL